MTRFVCNVPHLIIDELNYTEIFAEGSVGGGSTTIYTVPTGKTGYITGLTVGISQRVAAVYYGYVLFYRSGGFFHGRWLFNGSIVSEYALHIPINPPIKMASGGYIDLWSSNADYIMRLTALGYTL